MLLIMSRWQYCLKDNWRRGRDSNPRYLAVHTLSRRAPSATRTPLQQGAVLYTTCILKSIDCNLIYGSIVSALYLIGGGVEALSINNPKIIMTN